MPAQGHISPWYNADESPKLALEFGLGASISVGTSRQVQNGGWNYLMGGGYSFSRRWSVLMEYGYNHFRSPHSEIEAVFGPSASSGGASVVGDTHLWKWTLDPSYRFYAKEHVGLYVLAGGGFFRKREIFRTQPTSCTNSCGNPTNNLYDTTNNAGGIEGGFGISQRPGLYNNARLFAEVRYVWVDNKPGLGGQFYAPAAQPTHFLPITAGIRW